MQNARQFDSSAVNSRFHSSFRYIQNLPNFVVFELLQIAQYNGFAQFRRKLGQSRVHLRTEFAEKQLLIRAASRRLLVFNHWHSVLERVCNAVALGAPIMVDQEVARNAGHPGCEPAMGGSIAPKSLIHPEENFLRQVFGFRAIASKPVANVEDAARVTAHKFLPGRTVALEALLDQLGVLLQRIISLESRYGDQFDPKAAWGQLRPATMERKLLSKSSLLSWPGRPSASGGILLMPAAGHKHGILELELLPAQGTQLQHLNS